MTSLEEKLKEQKYESKDQAIDALARYKFMMFGYHAAVWVHLNQIDSNKEHNPFRPLVEKAREIQREALGKFEEKEASA